MEQGAQFASVTAAGALTGGIAWLAFALVYAWAAMQLSWWAALATGLLAYLAVGLILVAIAPPFVMVVIAIVAIVVLGPRFFPRPLKVDTAPRSSGYEIYVRMLAGGAMTVLVTRLSPMLGPKFSGLLSVFPVMGIVLAAFSHRASGGAFTVRLLRGMFSGFYAFTAFCLTVSLALPFVGTAAGFALAVIFSLTVHVCVLRLTHRPSEIPSIRQEP